MIKVVQTYTYEQYAGEVDDFLNVHDKEVVDVWEVLELMQDCLGIEITIPKEDEPYFEGYTKQIIEEHNQTIEEMREEKPAQAWLDIDKKNSEFFTRGD